MSDTLTEPLSGQQKMAVARAARAFSAYGDARKAMATIAKAIVNLRMTFEKDGRPDFRGDTPQYRGAIASLYEAAIPDPEERKSFKVAIRYWIAKEYASRVQTGKISRADLEAAGIMGRNGGTSNRASTREPRRAATEADLTPTGVTVDGDELRPNEVLAEAERIVAEHVKDNSLGVILAMQSIGRELGPVVAALRDPEVRDKQPGRSLKQAAETILLLALDLASLSGLDVQEHVGEWSQAVTMPTAEEAAVA
jgi:hypothetical protein